MKNISTVNILNEIKLHKQTKVELSSLIEFSYKISLSILKLRFSSNGLFLYADGLSIEDIAMDAIVPLFVNNSEGILGIERSMKLWNNYIITEADAEHFLMQVIWKRVEQTTTDLLKQRDPIFEKIHKTLSTCIIKNKLKKTYHLGTVYVLEKGSENINGKILSDEFFKSIPISYFRLKQITLFNALFEYVKNESEFAHAIPLNKLVKQIKFLYFHSYKTQFSKQSNFNDTFIYNDIVDESLKTIDIKLETFYIKKNKVSKQDAEYIMASFKDISLDIKNGGMHGTLYSYLEKNKPLFSKKVFYAEYHSIMNYLFNQFKTEIVKNFE